MLDPQFWRQIDYVLSEQSERVIGAWESVGVVKGFAGDEIVRPGGEPSAGDATEGGHMLKRVEKPLRTKVTKSWWAQVKMQPKVNILKR